MCGIFGAVVDQDSSFHRDTQRQLNRLYTLSASRGKEAAGVAIANDRTLTVFKEPIPATTMIKLPAFKQLVDRELDPRGRSVAFIGHSRLVTDGAREVNLNNQPVVSSGFVGVHNGIVVNHDALWKAHPELVRHFAVDSEVIFALLRHHLAAGDGVARAVSRTFGEIKGAASIAALSEDGDQLILATNNGSLYYRGGRHTFVFASERYIMRSFLERGPLHDELGTDDILAVPPGEGVIVDMNTLVATPFSFAEPPVLEVAARSRPRPIEDRSPTVVTAPAVVLRTVDFDRVEARFPYQSTTYRLRRCTKCVLPESMPFIEFDEQGVCNYCHKHLRVKTRGLDALEEIVGPHRRKDGRPDCVLGISGGRDSMYGLHYVKTELKLNPVAFTYDWGMVTDLARRNVSRICGKLGIEHILVSADIDQKREFIRKNVEAWLRRPELGAVPLFMAGDKAYFHHLNRVRKQLGTPLGILCENLLERTDFKSGFAGVKPAIVDDVRAYTLNPTSKLQMLRYYGTQFVKNPAYLNSSLVDSALAFVWFYVIERSYTNLYGYVPWNEDVVNRTLIDEYDFELAPDTDCTWRIGDGTAPFYNYIYHSIAGFTEHDALRSNQVREGVITRDEALRRIDRENQPRFQSIQWYLDVLRIERRIEDVLAAIQAAPKLYKLLPEPATRPTAAVVSG